MSETSTRFLNFSQIRICAGGGRIFIFLYVRFISHRLTKVEISEHAYQMLPVPRIIYALWNYVVTQTCVASPQAVHFLYHYHIITSSYPCLSRVHCFPKPLISDIHILLYHTMLLYFILSSLLSFLLLILSSHVHLNRLIQLSGWC